METENHNKIYSLLGEYLYEGPFTISSTDGNESVEDVIDFADTEETAQAAAEEIKNEVNDDAHDNKIYSDSGECLFESSYAVCDSTVTAPELLDFEALIDSEQNTEDKLREFQNILNAYQTSAENNCNFNDVMGLEEINNIFVNIVTESNCLNTNTVPIEQNNEMKVINSEDFLDIDWNEVKRNIKLETQGNDAASTAVREDTNFKDDNNLDTAEETCSINSDGYHSSDFEFITESEAVMDGYIIHLSTVDCSFQNDNERQDNSVESSEDDNYPINRTTYSNNLYQYRQFTKSRKGENSNSEASDPGEGPSGFNEPIEDYCDRSYREDHQIPDDEGYLELFQGPNVLPLADIILLENKSTRPLVMNSQYEGIGFDMRIMRQLEPDSSEEEYADEARESLDKILSMYPYENKKPRKR